MPDMVFTCGGILSLAVVLAVSAIWPALDAADVAADVASFAALFATFAAPDAASLAALAVDAADLRAAPADFEAEKEINRGVEKFEWVFFFCY